MTLRSGRLRVMGEARHCSQESRPKPKTPRPATDASASRVGSPTTHWPGQAAPAAGYLRLFSVFLLAASFFALRRCFWRATLVDLFMLPSYQIYPKPVPGVIFVPGGQRPGRVGQWQGCPGLAETLCRNTWRPVAPPVCRQRRPQDNGPVREAALT